MANPYSSNRVLFSGDSIELASGFFYNTLGEDDEYPQGKYPYVYYGNKEKYRKEQDSLFIYSKPYERWNSFKIDCIRDDKLLLVGKSDTVLLNRNAANQIESKWPIKYIRVHVHDGDLSLFRNDYRVTYSDDDRLIFQQLNSFGKDTAGLRFNLKPGTFRDMCEGFSFVNLTRLRKIYTTEISEINTIKLQIGMKDGHVLESEIQNMSCPDELRLALIPVLYTHQQYIYPTLPPAK